MVWSSSVLAILQSRWQYFRGRRNSTAKVPNGQNFPDAGSALPIHRRAWLIERVDPTAALAPLHPPAFAPRRRIANEVLTR
jgi:hypothetical protein